MGKKSKRKATKSAGAASSATYNPPSIPSALPVPAEGWAMELEDAEKLLKRKGATVNNLLRLCRAYWTMRQWGNLKNRADQLLARSEEANESTSDVKEELARYQREALQELSVPSRVTDASLRDYFHHVLTEHVSIDESIFDNQYFNNLNLLQFAAIEGDVRLLEKVVALGAAIDFPPPPPPQQENDNFTTGHLQGVAPPSCSALLLACASLIMNSELVADKLKAPEALNGNLECAVQLVRLGADCRLKLSIPESSCGVAATMWRLLGINNKTAKELALLSGKQELIDTMEAFSSNNKDTMIRTVHCRCGSRLPWKDCHLAGLPPETLAMDRSDGKIVFRYSPLAPCYCNNSNKNYWMCCWESPHPSYQDDRTGKLHGQCIITDGQPGGKEAIDLHLWATQELKNRGIGENEVLVDGAPDRERSLAAQLYAPLG